MSDDAPKKPGRPSKKVNTQSRIFAENRKIFHDLFKLTVSKMFKNMSWHPIPPEEYTAIEHCHFFHTFDSSGRPQIHSTSVGGHFHIMKVVPGPDGAPPQVVCESGPMKLVRRKNRYGKYEKKVVPVNDVDNHMHETIYLQSNEVQIRKMNDEAVKVIGANANLTAKPSGLDVKV